MKAKTFLIADGETTGIGNKAVLFDFAYVIATRKADILERRFLVRETLCNPAVMLGAYFNKEWRAMMGAKLFADYIPEIARGDARLYSWHDIVATLRDDMLTHSVDVFSAYNLQFDQRAIVKTNTFVTGSRSPVLPYRPDLLCIWNFACNVIANTPTYHAIARQNNWVSDAGNIRTNAEKIYAYLTGNPAFIEAHTALEDARIETEILRRCLRKKKAIPYNADVWMPWKLAQTVKRG